MRSWFALALLSVVAPACKNKSKLDDNRGSQVDALWDLAPDGTQLGIVASAHAVDLAFDAIAAVREVSGQSDFTSVKPQIDELARAMFGSDSATPADAGYGSRPFALFETADGVVGVMPVVDRDKFMAAKHGTRGSNGDDTLEANKCREMRGYYVCATENAVFDPTKGSLFSRIGKGSLRGKVDTGGERGDAEVYVDGVKFLGDTTGTLGMALQLERGAASLTGHWNGKPSGLLEKVVGVTSPRPQTQGAAGFVSFDAAPLLASVPQIPIAGGVTTDQLAAAMVGPITASVPAGTLDIQVHIPLKDPSVATKIIDNCQDISMLFALADKQQPGACRIRLQGTSELELDLWVEGNELRLGSAKGPAPAGKPGAMTALGRELASKDWTASLWGRGTMLTLPGELKPSTNVPDELAFGVHAISLMNELGAAVRVEADGVHFRAAMRTVWSNPPDVVAKYIAIPGADIATGTSTTAAKQLAATAPSSPFAADFDAGQGGLLIPAAAVGLATAVIIPAINQYLGGGGPPTEDPSNDPTAGMPPMDQGDLTSVLLHAYVDEAFPKWKSEHAGSKCPASIDELAALFGDTGGVPIKQDPWGHDLVMTCSDSGITMLSVGPDGVKGSLDDVHVP